MTDKTRDRTDTFFVRPRKGGDSQKNDPGSYPQNDKLNFPDGRTVQALPREVFEEALRAATLKE